MVTIFKMGSPNEELGEVDAKLGAAPAASRTRPAFKVAVTHVATSAAGTPSRSTR